MRKLVVLMTCHNRKEKTLACLRALFAAEMPEGIGLEVVLVDDASTDGTGSAAAALDPRVCVHYGDGSLFWNGGMRLAFAESMKRQFDFYLWLNDDTTLVESGVRHLIGTYDSLREVHGDQLMIVGATRDSESNQLTYGGFLRSGGLFRPLALELVRPSEAPVPCDTMNGNCVLIPAVIPALIGNLDPEFNHGLGDIDYGLRANKAGCAIWVAAGFIGTCSRNVIAGTYLDRHLPLGLRIRAVFGIKGLPPKPWAIYTRRHSGIFWPLYWAWPYLKTAISGLHRMGRR